MRPSARRRWLALVTGLSAASVAALLVLLPAVAAPAAVLPVGPGHLVRSGLALGHSNISVCASGLAGPDSAYLCGYSSAHGGPGNAWATFALQANIVRSNLSGTLPVGVTGVLNLSGGYASLRESCFHNGSSSAQVYLFESVSVYDVTNATTVGKTTIPFWDAGPYICSATGFFPTNVFASSSPYANSTVNSSRLAPLSVAFTAGHRYVITAQLGCGVSTQVFFSSPADQASAGAFCDVPSGSSNTVTIQSINVG